MSAPAVSREWLVRFFGELAITGTADEVFAIGESMTRLIEANGYKLVSPVLLRMAPASPVSK